jgi:hypothetical protein
LAYFVSLAKHANDIFAELIAESANVTKTLKNVSDGTTKLRATLNGMDYKKSSTRKQYLIFKRCKSLCELPAYYLLKKNIFSCDYPVSWINCKFCSPVISIYTDALFSELSTSSSTYYQQFERLDQQVISRKSAPVAVLEIYNTVQPSPSLNELNKFRDDGKESLKFFTDPDYFFQLWFEQMKQQTEQQQQKKKKKKVSRLPRMNQ